MLGNALAATFFSSIKGELLDGQTWTRPGARRAITEYIAWYNGTRPPSAGFRGRGYVTFGSPDRESAEPASKP